MPINNTLVNTLIGSTILGVGSDDERIVLRLSNGKAVSITVYPAQYDEYPTLKMVEVPTVYPFGDIGSHAVSAGLCTQQEYAAAYTAASDALRAARQAEREANERHQYEVLKRKFGG